MPPVRSATDADIVIIGAGHNGLVAAFYLARAGRRVLVLEALPRVGGACTTEELIPGYRFSTCANLLWGMRPKIVSDLELVRRGLRVDARGLLRLMPDGQYVFSDHYQGTSTAGGAMAALQQALAPVSEKDAAALPRWQALLDRLTHLFGPFLLREPPSLVELQARCRDEGDRQALETVLSVPLRELLGRYFESDVMRNQRSGADIGDGDAPGSALALAVATALGSYSETGDAVLNGYVRGGMGRLSELIREAAEEAGAVVQTGTTVAQILTRDGRATGVELASGERLSSRVVVSNADPKRTFLSLIPPAGLDPAFRRRVEGLATRGAAGLKLHCALSKPPRYRIRPGLTDRQLLEATALFVSGADEQGAAWAAASAGELPEVPVVSGFLPSVFDQTLCPPGHLTWSAYVTWVPVRPRRGSWADRKDEMAERVFRVMDRHTSNFRDVLLDFVLLTPQDLEEGRLLTDGNIHHVDGTAEQLLWRRPLPELARYRTPLSGLYLCGSGTHPWGEVTGAPGHNAAHAVLADMAEGG